MVVDDHLDRRRLEAGLRSCRAGRHRARPVGRGILERAARRARARDRCHCRGRFEDPALAHSEREFLELLRPAFTELTGELGPALFVGGAASLLGEVRADELEACQRLLEALERRAAILEMLGETLGSRRPYVRVGGELESPRCGTSRSSGRRTAFRREPSVRSPSSGRCAWTTRRRSSPSGRQRTSSPASSSPCTKTTRRVATLGSDGDDGS